MPIPKKRYLFLCAICLLLAFSIITVFVAKQKFTNYDFDTTVKIQDHIPHTFDFVFSLFSLLGTAEVTMIIWLGIMVWAIVKRYWLTVASLLLLPFALGVEIIGKLFVPHPSPPHAFYRGVINFVFPSSELHTDYSFPSGHLTRTSFLVTFFMVYFLYRKGVKKQFLIQGVFVVILFLMSLSRIYLGEHWTSDVLGGLFIGSSFGIISGLTIPVKKSASSLPDKVE